MSPATAWLALMAICALCIVLLARKIRAFDGGLKRHALSLSCNIVFENISKFYGEVLGVNRVNLVLDPGSPALSVRTVPGKRR